MERAKRTVEQAIRCKYIARDHWVPLIPSVERAMNAAPNRMTGMSPYKIVYGREPTSPLHAELRIRPPFLSNMKEEGDTIEFATKLVFSLQAISDEVKKKEKENFEKELERIKRHAGKKNAHKVGNYVLIHRDRPSKLLLEWQGPFEVVNQESDYIYTVRSLATNDEKRVHANALHRFVPGNLTKEQLTVAVLERDFLIVQEV